MPDKANRGGSGSLSAILTAQLGVTLTDYSALPLLTIICSLSKLVALPFIFMVRALLTHKLMIRYAARVVPD